MKKWYGIMKNRKLTVKIAAAAGSLLLILSQAFSLWNLLETRRMLMENIAGYEWERLRSSASEFSLSYRENKDKIRDERGTRFWASELFRRRYSANTVLYYRGEELCNSTPYEFDIARMRERSEEQDADWLENGVPDLGYNAAHVFLEQIDGRYLMLLYEPEDIEPFLMLRYRDVTPIYQAGRTLFWRGAALAAGLTALLLVLLTLIIRRILKPFYRLRDTANRIAGGDYTQRAVLSGQDEVGEVAESFNMMADRVEAHVRELSETNEKQRRLLGALSHELKTPMTGIQGYAQLLQKIELSPEKQADALAYIEQECRRLSRLSVKMLQLVELSSEEEMERKPLEVRELFAQTRKITQRRLQEKKLQLQAEAEPGLMVTGDSDLLISFLVNLVDNAAKASGEGSEIRLVGSREGLFVEDSGCGIPSEELARVTEPFYMVDRSRSRRAGGAGLGLALCAQIARLHGGELSVESTVGKGSRIGLRWQLSCI